MSPELSNRPLVGSPLHAIESIWNDYPLLALTTQTPGRIDHDLLLATIHAWQSARGMIAQPWARSVEGRPIFRVTIGQGPRRVVLWSQMHGDEPTHTVVLLELINALLTPARWTWAEQILNGCTLTIVPMLNPDGAARWTRYNAQTIDVNRDARRLATAEGQALHDLISENDFEFAFNLHNQHRRITVDGKRLAAVSLLVPPLDDGNTETTATRRAECIAGAFVRGVRPYCQSMLSRYDAGYMPRCFGEWVQAQGISTLLVEAGGASVLDRNWLTRVHFCGVVAALLEISAGYRENESTVADYRSLPVSSTERAFDLLLRGVRYDFQGMPTTVDLGINTRQTACSHESDPHIGVIDDLGDLADVGALTEVAFATAHCRPGRVAYVPSWNPHALPKKEELLRLLKQGVTTVIGEVSLADRSQCLALHDLNLRDYLPVNLAFLAQIADAEKIDAFAMAAAARAIGVLGILRPRGATEATELDEMAARMGIPCLDIGASRTSGGAYWLAESTTAQLVPDRCVIGRGQVADLLLILASSHIDDDPAALPDFVVLNGSIAVEQGNIMRADCGRVLRRS